MNMDERKRIVIVGGGITGLSAAYKLQRAMHEQNVPLDITLVEAADRLGGKIDTVRRDGFVIERGPDSFLIRKQSIERLAESLGIADELVRNATGQAFVLLHDRLHPIPGGSVMGIPTELSPFIGTELFSWKGKLRAAGDFLLPRSGVKGDQPVGPFFRRRFGNEVVENLIEPLLSGVYSGDINYMSLQATFPQFAEAEKKHRSLILGMKKSRPKKRPAATTKETKKLGAFHTFRNGLSTLVESLEEALKDDVRLITGNGVVDIDHAERGVTLTLQDGTTLEADDVILATSHQVAGRIMRRHELLQEVSTIPTTSTAAISLAYDADQVVQEQDGTGFLVSKKNDYDITACTWTSRKWPTTTPDGKVLLRAFVGRVGEEHYVEYDDDTLVDIAKRDLGKIFTIQGEPNFSVVTRFKEDRPQYRVGHKERVAHARRQLNEVFPMIQLAGASYDGVGLPDCVDQGEAAAERIIRSARRS